MSKYSKIKSITTPVIAQADTAAVQHQHYVDQFVTRGRQELYNVLASIYAVCIAVENSGHKDAVVEHMRKLLRQKHGIKTSTKSAPIAIVIRYITHAATKTVSVYKRVLCSAMDAGISEADLPAYITNNGGVDKCGKAIANAEAAKAEQQRDKDIRKASITNLRARQAIGTVEFDGGKTPNMHAIDVKLQYLAGKWNHETQQYEIVSVLYPSLAIEEQATLIHLACCKAASLDDGSGKFGRYCKEFGLNMDNVHKWMKLHNIKNHDEAKANMKSLLSLLDTEQAAPALAKAA